MYVCINIYIYMTRSNKVEAVLILTQKKSMGLPMGNLWKVVTFDVICLLSSCTYGQSGSIWDILALLLRSYRPAFVKRPSSSTAISSIPWAH